MGLDSLTFDQQSRLSLLRDVVASLREEVTRLDEVLCGEFYDDNDELVP